MSASVLSEARAVGLHVIRGAQPGPATIPTKPLPSQVAPGRLVEISGPGCGYGTACITTAVSIVVHAQAEGDTVAWIQPVGGPLYPPDLHDAGVDLDALVVVHIPLLAGPRGQCKAAELLLRSGALGLLVVDLTMGVPAGSGAWLGRLSGLARQYQSRIVLLTQKTASTDSLGALVGLRVGPQRFRQTHGRFVIEHQLIKNKSGAAVEMAPDSRRGPWGLG